jgi:hypothetical protein
MWLTLVQIPSLFLLLSLFHTYNKCTIKQAAVPPYRIENRSNTHYLRFQQVDDDALPFVLPPMRARGYTWDNPYGRKKLRVSVVQESESASDTYDFGIHSRVYAMKNAGRQSTLPHSTPDDYRFIIHTHLRISAGTKILSFNDSDYVIDEVDKGGDFDRPEGPTALCAATMSGSRRGLQDLCMEFDSI